jgi:signal transduction histidine kinase
MSASHEGASIVHLSQDTLDLLPIAALVATVPSGDVVRFNWRAAALCGADDLLPARLGDLLRGTGAAGEPLPAAHDPIAAAVANGWSVDEADALLRARNGSMPVFASLEPLREADGRVTAALVVCHDASRWKSAVDDAVRRNDEFLGVLGHELRNPMAAIVAAVRLLQAAGPADPLLVRARDTILRQATLLSRLVDDLLDAGRIGSGKLRLTLGPAELNAIARQAIETCAPAIDERGHALEAAFLDRPVPIEADASRLVQVVCNLLNNAAKYTRRGGRIRVAIGLEGHAGVVRVSDDGVGIPPEMLDRIFEPYVQIGSSAHRSEGGLGLGLALVKAVVELHGGTVEARSEGIAAGSEFIVRLPLAG